MEASDLTEKWVKKELTEKEILFYLLENISANLYHNHNVIKHVSELCYSIYMWSTGQVNYLCDFLEAVAKNDLTEAVNRADDMNRTALWLYVGFLYNVAPAGWKDSNQNKGS